MKKQTLFTRLSLVLTLLLLVAAVLVGCGEFFKNHLAQPLRDAPVIVAENLDDRFNGHVVMEQTQTGGLHQFLADRHLTDSTVAE